MYRYTQAMHVPGTSCYTSYNAPRVVCALLSRRARHVSTASFTYHRDPRFWVTRGERKVRASRCRHAQQSYKYSYGNPLLLRIEVAPGNPGLMTDGVVGAYSFVSCLGHVTTDHASFSSRSTVPTPNRDTSKDGRSSPGGGGGGGVNNHLF